MASDLRSVVAPSAARVRMAMHVDRTTLSLERGDRSPIAPRGLLRAIAAIDDLVHVVIALLLLALALAVIGHTVLEFLDSDQPFPLAVTYAVNGVLFVIILMEILRTVVGHLTHGTFQLLPFIAIGIISAVRHILTVGSALTMGTTLDEEEFNRLLLELAVNTGVALGLVVALVLLRRSTRPSSPNDVNPLVVDTAVEPSR